MKLLFILDSVEFSLAPTPALARRVAGLLAGKGHEIHLLELWDGENPAPAEKGCTAHPLSFCDERIMNQILENGRKGGTPVALRLAKLCFHPFGALAAFRQIILKKPRRITAAAEAIERLDRQHHFDAAVAVAAPYAGSFALVAANIPGQKISWQMDPYAANESYSAPGSWQKEKELLAQLSQVFVAPPMAGYYAAGMPLESFRSKMQVLDFPALAAPEAKESTKHSGRIKCVFVGSLYPDIRTPHYALELFSAANLSDCELVFVGGGWQNYPADFLAPYKKVLGNRLVITGPVPKSQADCWLEEADVLISLGNSVHNQVPSKIFEYFAAGKPILHLAKLQDDPCIPYFKRWPLALSLWEQQGHDADICKQLACFLTEKAACRLPFSQAEELFRENTPAYAADLIEKCIEEKMR